MRHSRLLLVTSILVASAASTSLRTGAERQRHSVVLPEQSIEFPVAYSRIVALSFDPLVADLLWLRFLHAVPMSPADPQTGRALATRLRAVVELDPDFRSAYLHGSILLSVLGAQPCAALDILEEGIPRFPDDWRLPFQAGYNCFAEIGDPECAARHMQQAASMNGSAPWLPALAARLLADATKDQAAVEYLQMQLSRTTDPALRARFEERLGEALLGRDLSAIDGAVRAFRRVNDGALPASLEQLVDEGLLQAVPANDPFGGTYVLTVDGRAGSTSGRKRLRSIVRQTQFRGNIEENLLEERVISRLSATLEKPPWVRTSLDGVAASATILELAVQGLETAIRHTDDADVVTDLRVFQARAMIRGDVDRMRRARLSLLRKEPAASPTLDAIRSVARAPATDPFGSPYVLDADGRPGPGTGRIPLSPIFDGRGKYSGATACR